MNKKINPVPSLVETYETEIEFTCPVRGKVKQKVMVKRYATVRLEETIKETPPTKNMAIKLDEKFSSILVPDDSLDEQPPPNKDEHDSD